MNFPVITETFTVGPQEFAVFGVRDIMGVGLYYKNDDDNNSDRQEFVLFLNPGDHVEFAREPENKYDEFAIALYHTISDPVSEISVSRRIGYVPGNIAKTLAPLIDNNPEWKPVGWVTKIGLGNNGNWFKFKVASDKKIVDKLLYKQFMAKTV